MSAIRVQQWASFVVETLALAWLWWRYGAHAVISFALVVGSIYGRVRLAEARLQHGRDS